MKILKEAFITKTSIEDIVEMAEKHPLAIERLKKIRDEKKEGYFEDLIKDMYPDGIFLENLFDILENDIDLVEDELGVKFESMKEDLTVSDKYIPRLRGKSAHTMTKDRKFDVDFDEEGNVVASERHFPRRYFSGHISDKVNDFPYTDEDNIILAAREQHKRNFGKEESLKESSLKETAYGKDELWNQINNTEYAYNALSRKVKECVEKGLPKDYIVTAVRKVIYSMKDDFGRLPTTQEERQELAQDFVEDELQGYSFEADSSVPSYRARGKWVKESLSEGFKIGSQDIQSVKVYNPYNYTIQELRINNRDKTFERGNFTMWKADKKTHNKQEYEDIVDKLKDMGYTEIPSDYRSLRNKTRKGIPQREELTEANLSDVERQLERAKSAGDNTQAWDLALCIENDEDLYRRFVTPAIENLKRKIKRGVFDETLAIQLFYYVVENSLKSHARWFPYELKDVSVPTRYLAAEELYNFFEDEIKSE